jgi:hypothetical protein
MAIEISKVNTLSLKYNILKDDIFKLQLKKMRRNWILT